MNHAIDILEFAAVDKENGWHHLRAGVFKGGAHGLYPVWNGAGIRARLAALLDARAAKAGAL